MEAKEDVSLLAGESGEASKTMPFISDLDSYDMMLSLSWLISRRYLPWHGQQNLVYQLGCWSLWCCPCEQVQEPAVSVQQ
jgi:hypothetical protein